MLFELSLSPCGFSLSLSLSLSPHAFFTLLSPLSTSCFFPSIPIPTPHLISFTSLPTAHPYSPHIPLTHYSPTRMSSHFLPLHSSPPHLSLHLRLKSKGNVKENEGKLFIIFLFHHGNISLLMFIC